MSKNNSLKREARKFRDCDFKPSNVIDYERQKYRLQPLNESQRQYISALSHDDFVVGAGAAGVGKTYIASRIAGQLYRDSKNIKRITMTRPNVEVGQKMGHLPGEIEDKYAPYIVPFEKGLKDELGNKYYSDLHKGITAKPLAYMRGETFDDAVMLLDEAQNTTVTEMKMFLTRVGTNSRIFISGDEGQSDIKGTNGLQWLLHQVRSQGLNFEVVQFTKDDCVRSDLCLTLLTMIEGENKVPVH